MSDRRLAKMSSAIRQVVSSSILTELRDPRVKNVTVMGVDVDGDLRGAKVKVSIMGDEKTERLCLKGLHSSRGYLQSRLADMLEMRYTPVLRFEVDRGVKRSLETSQLLRTEIGGGSDDGPADGELTEEGVEKEDVTADNVTDEIDGPVSAESDDPGDTKVAKYGGGESLE
ncbi:30S ribosome-binding factor RbfA [Stratiformator vulcanicus]|uniref:Ribosome-binding factor A n=1 Tax=Stratiformator vulcanicus TaxID=2527980 RepID=A0A517R4T2_9PLAN|nr:30S ribosome-binding factor RbfA [Stratiformator vulcanicus]QDT38881.1 Ribosome-binding factor A [Stratiformator vulcanicus]